MKLKVEHNFKEWKFIFPQEMDDVFDEYWEAIDLLDNNEKECQKKLRKIIAQFPECHLDAYNHLSISYRNQKKVTESFQYALTSYLLGKSAFSKAFDQKNDKITWSYLDNRPFLRACQILGLEYQYRKNFTRAIELYKEILSYNRNDNQGIRYLLLDCYLQSENYTKFKKLLDQYDEDYSVTPNFYASLRFLESNSVIDITSTPKISTLNGHEATFSVGETSYYQEERVNVESSIGGPVQISNKIWKQTEANLDITVKPFVSADEYVTLQISVAQNDFQGKVDPTAPPNQSTQSFTSLIRVKNGEMILMGGLDRDSDSDSGSGVPFLSRIPILKWLFSDRQKEKEKSKLHIFIKPTVTY